MATAKQRVQGQHPRRHRLRNGLILLALSVALAMALFWRPLQAQARLGASYGARVACTCHFIEGRALPDCRKDFEPGMALVVLSENDARSITARVPLMASETATYREGAGCLLQNWAP